MPLLLWLRIGHTSPVVSYRSPTRAWRESHLMKGTTMNIDTNHLDLIVKNGTVKIPSIFLFQYFDDVTRFLNHAKKQNCTVIFENEDLTVAPNENDAGIRAKINIFATIIACREIGNAYVRFVGNIDQMSWDNAESMNGETYESAKERIDAERAKKKAPSKKEIMKQLHDPNISESLKNELTEELYKGIEIRSND